MDKPCQQHAKELQDLKAKNELQDTHASYTMEKLDKIEKNQEKGFQEIKDLIEAMDDKYASKNVERIVYGIVILLALSAFYFIMDAVRSPALVIHSPYLYIT